MNNDTTDGKENIFFLLLYDFGHDRALAWAI